MEMLGFVEDVREPLARYAVFVCPILSGSGVRVKLLEAFAAGIPVVSTTVGAEGLAREGRRVLRAGRRSGRSSPSGCWRCCDDPETAAAMAARARAEVEANWDMAAITAEAGGGLSARWCGEKRTTNAAA